MDPEEVEKLVKSAMKLRREKHISYEDFLNICELEPSEMLILKDIKRFYFKKGFGDITKIRIEKLIIGLGKLEKLSEPSPNFFSIKNIFEEYREEIPCRSIYLDKRGYIECDVPIGTGNLSNFIQEFLRDKGYYGDIPKINMCYSILI